MQRKGVKRVGRIMSPLDENHMTRPPRNKLERGKHPEPRMESVFFPTLDQIGFCFVVQEFRKVERLSKVEDQN